MNSAFHQRANPSHRNGVALVITLALIVLLTLAVLAFFSFVTSNRRIEASRADRAKADLLCSSGEASVMGAVLKEIAAPASSSAVAVGGVTIYKPVAAKDSVPQRHLATVILPSQATFFNLLRQSVPTADDQASAHGTDLPAKNGRKIDAARWNLPVLLPSGGFTQDTQLPHWIYVDRLLGLTKTPSANVIGRFAYNVYDLGGLLNANISGYPSGLAGDLLSHLKGTQGGADISFLSASLASGDINAVTAFRFPDAPSPTDFVGRMLGASGEGFLTVRGNDNWSGLAFKQNMFTSRQDLIRYARTQNNNLQQALPYLTHFSRTVNAPSWNPPVSPANTNPVLLDIRFASDATITHYDDKGVAGTYTVKAGEPFLQRRFSLGKLAWLTPTGPASGISDAAIQSVFGLKWSGAAERWNYVGPTGNVTRDSISTLASVAAETTAREPNFFEVLKAGVLTGSLGAAAKGKTSATAALTSMSVCTEGNATLDASKDLHLLRIGANIIDCSDNDNFPTILALSFGGLAIERAGVEDLPYFYTVDTSNFRVLTPDTSIPGKTHRMDNSDFVWIPEFINPHRLSVSSSGPGSIVADISNGLLMQVGYATNTSLAPGLSASPLKDLSALPAIEIPKTKFENFRPAPQPARDGGATNRIGVTVPYADGTIHDVLGFHLFSYTKASDFTGVFPIYLQADSKLAVVQVSGLVMRLRYRSPAGNLKTYSTLGGSEDLATLTGIDGIYRDDFLFRVLKQSNMLSSSPTIKTILCPSLFAWDPRSSRFGPGIIRYERPMAEAPAFVSTSGNGLVGPQLFFPNIYFRATTNPKTGFPGNLPQYPAFEDPDYDSTLGPRPPDAGIGFTLPGSTATSANPYKTLTDEEPRPVILQRPYRNVGELGYVFRDTPWQTLDFFNSRSADAALLDLFSVRDEAAISAEGTSLVSRNLPVLKALLSGTAQKADATTTFSPAEVDNVAAAFQAYAFTSGDPSVNLPVNLAELTGFMSSTDLTAANLSKIKYRREAVVRALSSTQTRTWNMLVDVVAQAGRFPGTDLSSGGFQVEGESRSWTSLAVDRYSGKIIDQQTEKVHE